MGNMSMVDKSMFSAGNMTRSTMDQLQRGGYVKEITKQGNQEFEDKDGSAKPYKSPFGDMIDKDDFESGKVKIPFIDDDDSKMERSNGPNEPKVEGKKSELSAAEASTTATVTASTTQVDETVQNKKTKQNNETMNDPLDSLTVVRLKEILREHKLKVSGTKQQLKDRLQAHIDSLLTN